MSGGSYNYIYCTLSQECDGRMYDAEMNDLIVDLCKVLHDLEYWQNCDSSEEEYRKTVAKFKEKWFQGSREERLKGYIDEQLGMTRQLLYNLCSIPDSAKPEFEKVMDEIHANKGKEVVIVSDSADNLNMEREQAYYRGYEDGIQKGRESAENKGEWIECHPLQPDDTAYMCSKCHSGDYGCERYDFCPWCGADMRGDKAE